MPGMSRMTRSGSPLSRATPRERRHERVAAPARCTSRRASGVVDGVTVERDPRWSRPRPRARTGERELLGVGDQHADARGRQPSTPPPRAPPRRRWRCRASRDFARRRTTAAAAPTRAPRRRRKPTRANSSTGCIEQRRQRRAPIKPDRRQQNAGHARDHRHRLPLGVDVRHEPDARSLAPRAASRFTPRARANGRVEHAAPAEHSEIASATTTATASSARRAARESGRIRRPRRRSRRRSIPPPARPNAPVNLEYSNGVLLRRTRGRARRPRSTLVPRPRRGSPAGRDAAPSRARCDEPASTPTRRRAPRSRERS